MIIVRRPSPFLRAWYRDRVWSSHWMFSPHRIRRPYHWWHPTITTISALCPSYRCAVSWSPEFQTCVLRTPSYCRIDTLVNTNQRLTGSSFDLMWTLCPSFWTFGSDLPETAAASAWNNTQNPTSISKISPSHLNQQSTYSVWTGILPSLFSTVRSRWDSWSPQGGVRPAVASLLYVYYIPIGWAADYRVQIA